MNDHSDQQAADETLMQAYHLHGDADAFNTLYARYHQRLYRFLSNRINGRANVDELFQDIWARIIKAEYQPSEQASFRTWLYTIARHRTIDFYRQQSLRSVADIAPSTDPDQLCSPDTDPEQLLGNTEICHSVQQALAQLPDEQREVFLLKAESGLSLQEIAVIQSENAETVKSRYRYAVKKLGQLLDT